jgi:hypothetical protein
MGSGRMTQHVAIFVLRGPLCKERARRHPFLRRANRRRPFVWLRCKRMSDSEFPSAIRYSPLPPLPFSASSPMCSTDTTCSSSAVSNTITPWVERPAIRMPSTGQRIN